MARRRTKKEIFGQALSGFGEGFMSMWGPMQQIRLREEGLGLQGKEIQRKREADYQDYLQDEIQRIRTDYSPESAIGPRSEAIAKNWSEQLDREVSPETVADQLRTGLRTGEERFAHTVSQPNFQYYGDKMLGTAAQVAGYPESALNLYRELPSMPIPGATLRERPPTTAEFGPIQPAPIVPEATGGTEPAGFGGPLVEKFRSAQEDILSGQREAGLFAREEAGLDVRSTYETNLALSIEHLPENLQLEIDKIQKLAPYIRANTVLDRAAENNQKYNDEVRRLQPGPYRDAFLKQAEDIAWIGAATTDRVQFFDRVDEETGESRVFFMRRTPSGPNKGKLVFGDATESFGETKPWSAFQTDADKALDSVLLKALTDLNQQGIDVDPTTRKGRDALVNHLQDLEVDASSIPKILSRFEDVSGLGLDDDADPEDQYGLGYIPSLQMIETPQGIMFQAPPEAGSGPGALGRAMGPVAITAQEMFDRDFIENTQQIQQLTVPITALANKLEEGRQMGSPPGYIQRLEAELAQMQQDIGSQISTLEKEREQIMEYFKGMQPSPHVMGMLGRQ